MKITKDIKDYEGLYQITDIGEVISLETDTKEYCLLKSFGGGKGYMCVKLSKGDRLDRKQKQIHRLVAETFIPNPENKPCVNHINGIRDDNRVVNLEWVNYRENATHKIFTKKPSSRYTGVSWNKTRQKWSSQICHNGKIITIGFFDDEHIASFSYKQFCECHKIENKYAVFATMDDIGIDSF